MWGLGSGELDVWGPVELFVGWIICELVVLEGEAIGTGVCVVGSVPGEVVGQGCGVWCVGLDVGSGGLWECWISGCQWGH